MPRVQRVIEPIISGDDPQVADDEYNDDIAYVRDLGLITGGPGLRISNPMYREIIVRILSAGIQEFVRIEPQA